MNPLTAVAMFYTYGTLIGLVWSMREQIRKKLRAKKVGKHRKILRDQETIDFFAEHARLALAERSRYKKK